MADSSTGGFLNPLSTLPPPIEGQTLNRFLQPAIAALTGLAKNYVIPGNQSEPPNAPIAGDAWCTFYYEKIDADLFPYIGHFQDVNNNGYDQLQRHELWAVNCDFFDLGTNGLAAYYAALLRDNLAIPQNREFLLPENFNFRSVGAITVIPVVFKQRWQYRERFTFYLKRQILRNYAVLNVESVQISFNVNGVLINVENELINDMSSNFTPDLIIGSTHVLGASPGWVLYNNNGELGQLALTALNVSGLGALATLTPGTGVATALGNIAGGTGSFALQNDARLIGLGGADATHDANYTLLPADAGTGLFHSSASAHAWSIDTHANQAIPVGSVIVLTTGQASGVVTLTPLTGVTFERCDGTAGTGARTMGPASTATARQRATNVWVLSGVFAS